MLTTVSKGRTYDFSHAVGGLYMPQPIGVVAGEGDMVYVLSRQYEQILDVPWNKTGTSAQVNRFTVTETAGDEEFLGASVSTVILRASLSGRAESRSTRKRTCMSPTSG